MSQILIATASDGNNLKLAEKISEVCTELNIKSEICQLTKYNLPLYHTEAEKSGVPSICRDLTAKFENARALIIVAPEYNGLIPPVLNNAIAWISRSSEDWRSAFNGKVTAIATHSGSGGIHALTAMRQQFSYLGSNVLGRQIHTHYKKEFSHKSAKSIVEQLVNLTG